MIHATQARDRGTDALFAASRALAEAQHALVINVIPEVERQLEAAARQLGIAATEAQDDHVLAAAVGRARGVAASLRALLAVEAGR